MIETATVEGFTPGARVWVEDNWRGGREDTVAKVYKNGNIVLAGVPGKQWRPWRDISGSGWSAHSVSDRYDRARVRLWTPEVDAELSEEKASAVRRQRWRSIQHRLEKVNRDAVTDEFLDAVESALSALEKESARQAGACLTG